MNLANCLGLIDGVAVKAACSVAATIILDTIGVSSLLYEVVFVSWIISLGLGILLDFRDRIHPATRFGQGGLTLLVYFGLILGTHQLVRIYPILSNFEAMTGAYCALNEVLRVHGYARKLGFTLLEPLTESINQYLTNITNGRKD